MLNTCTSVLLTLPQPLLSREGNPKDWFGVPLPLVSPRFRVTETFLHRDFVPEGFRNPDYGFILFFYGVRKTIS
jgi:hypothetical protein